MKIRIIALFCLFAACTSENKIRNTVEARIFLANHDWHDSNATFVTLDGEIHTASSSVKFTDQEVTSNKQTYMYGIEKKPGGDVISREPYFEITWFDNYLNENIKFYLYENGGGRLISTRWKLSTNDNVGKEIEVFEDDKAEEVEKNYSLQFAAYEAARTEVASLTSEGFTTSNLDITSSPPKIFQGTQVFCDSEQQWYYVVKVEGDEILLQLYEGKYSGSRKPDKPTETIAGRIKEGYKIITKDADGNEQEIINYFGDKIDVLGYEESVTSYMKCD